MLPSPHPGNSRVILSPAASTIGSATLRVTVFSNPLINFFFTKFPQAADFMRRHVLAVDPFIDSVAFDPKIESDLVDGEPSVFNHFKRPG
jgi:hypothetical protein